MSKRRLERERGRREAVADMSEDLSEGEKGDVVGDLTSHGESNRGRLPRISSVDAMETWSSQQKGKKLYIVLIRYGVKSLRFFCGNRDSILLRICMIFGTKSNYSFF